MPSETEIQALVAAAKDACSRAYCPYSRFPVGAAVRAADGHVFAASNVENASFGLTVCAERSAIFNAIGVGVREIAALVVYTPTEAPVTPCGACRQVLLEFGRDADVICACAGEQRLAFKASDLLPHGFTLPAS
jgi:cytidine deaminase